MIRHALRRVCATLPGAVWAATLAGCHSPYVQVSVENRSGAKVQLVEVDYPSASFGVGELQAGGVYHYRFKILGTGSTKIGWTDAHGQEHISKGPELHEGQEGILTVVLNSESPTWKFQPRP